MHKTKPTVQAEIPIQLESNLLLRNLLNREKKNKKPSKKPKQQQQQLKYKSQITKLCSKLKIKNIKPKSSVICMHCVGYHN